MADARDQNATRTTYVAADAPQKTKGLSMSRLLTQKKGQTPNSTLKEMLSTIFRGKEVKSCQWNHTMINTLLLASTSS